ncbi:MAG: C4-dicarboxylate TRAP transporter substrate-binding protein [Alphaproteobacteria bacterium]
MISLSRRRALSSAAGLAGAALLPPSLARAEETVKLTMASSHPTAVPWVGSLAELVVPESNKRLEAMGSEDRIDWTESYGGALYKFDKTLEAVADGLTDLGWVGTLWEESKMPLQNVTYYTPFCTDNLPLQLDIMNRLHEEIPELSGAWEKQKQVLLGSSGIETYHLLTKEPFESVDQLKGKKLVAAGTVGNWLRDTGAAPVNAGLPDFYNLIKTGVADGTLISFSGAFPFKLYEVAPYITKVSLGSQSTGGLAINRRTWDRLPEDVKTVLSALGKEYTAHHSGKLVELADVFEAKMIEAGATVTTLSADERKRWADGLPDIAGEWRDVTEERGEPAGRVLTAYMEALTAAGETPLRAWA